jgi:hypothetical protein
MLGQPRYLLIVQRFDSGLRKNLSRRVKKP